MLTQLNDAYMWHYKLTWANKGITTNTYPWYVINTQYFESNFEWAVELLWYEISSKFEHDWEILIELGLNPFQS